MFRPSSGPKTRSNSCNSKGSEKQVIPTRTMQQRKSNTNFIIDFTIALKVCIVFSFIIQAIQKITRAHTVCYSYVFSSLLYKMKFAMSTPLQFTKLLQSLFSRIINTFQLYYGNRCLNRGQPP